MNTILSNHPKMLLSIMDEHLAAHKEYKDAKRNAKSKREKRLAYERYQTKVNPYLE